MPPRQKPSTVVGRSDRLKADDFVNELINTRHLRDMTETCKVVTRLSESNDTSMYYLEEKGTPYVLRTYNSGVNREYAMLQQDLLKHIDNPEGKAHPGCEAVYFIALPVGWAIHSGKKGLVFRYAKPLRDARQPTTSDRAQVQDQIEFLLWLGYMPMDVSDHNILLADQNRCYLMNHNSVCKTGQAPRVKESASAPTGAGDDDQLNLDLGTTFPEDLASS